MYKKIMVPLDGSELAECVLPHVEAFIKGFKIGNVSLVRVVEPERNYGGEYATDPNILAGRESARQSSAKDYLNQIVEHLTEGDTAFQVEVMVPHLSLFEFIYVKELFIKALFFSFVLLITHFQTLPVNYYRSFYVMCDVYGF